ncbi:MAG: phenylalanine--tRNA ligase subunit beta [Bacteroidales bacterium]|jgi:phenylalanyl-tRNA synthetase beta chain|nr:phenylalanine--tRNA ligase subunit beta [Bacteroidales bacterium]
MKISYNWIREYLKTDKRAEELNPILTSIGLEVEAMEDWMSVKGGLKGVVSGQVKTCSKHPGADKLFVTTVDTGTGEKLRIVCGAPNVREGQKVLVATPGSVLDYRGKAIEIKRSKIRGEISEGMICAEDELGLGDSHEGIMVLPDDTPPGIPAHELFPVEYDTVYEIGLTPNRIDSGSHFGVARDLNAYFNLFKASRVSLPDVDSFRTDNNSRPIPVTVENETDCIRYSGLTISGADVRESPLWLQNRLRAIGLTPLNNVVDITNYVLHESGQPLHAFDADKIAGNRVIVKNLPDKTSFTTLDNEERELSGNDLMICDEEKGLCIAGVYGGKGSGVTAKTANIFLESACFNPIAIRKTARRHDLHTDASFRFERGSDPNITIWALKRAALLIKELAGGKISSEIVDVYPNKVDGPVVELSFSNITRLAGKEIDKRDIKKILASLDIEISEEGGDILSCKVPTYRVDVTREADIIEEILRIYGYNNIEFTNKVNSTLSFFDKPNKEKVINTVSDMLSGAGFTEIMSNSLNPSAWYRESPDFDNRKLLILANPLSSDLDCMRQSLLYGGLSAISRNINRQNPDLRFYEFGICYFKKEKENPGKTVENYHEELSLDLFITGNKKPENWNVQGEKTDFYSIKSIIEIILRKLGFDLDAMSLKERKQDYYSEGLEMSIKGDDLVHFGKISRHYLDRQDVKQDVYYGHIKFDRVLEKLKEHSIYFSELPKYPSVRRDLALLVDRSVSFEQIRSIAYKTEKNLLREVGLFDVYESENLGKNKKSYAVSFILRDNKRTLTDKIIDKVMAKLIKAFETESGAQIR